MKLKTFENFIDKFQEELQDFCETYLAYLLDDSKYQLEVVEETQMSEPTYKIIFTIDKLHPDSETPIPWKKIKDYIIQFYHILNKNYTICQAPIWMPRRSKNRDNFIAMLPVGSSWNVFSPDQLDDVRLEKLYLTSIIFYVSKF